MDLAFDDLTFLIALLSWYVIIEAKLVLDLEVGLLFPIFINIFWHAPKFLKKPKGGSQGEIIEEEENWGMLPNSQHFGGRRVC